jgi:4-hydroxybenzoate polyprenyltransferase
VDHLPGPVQAYARLARFDRPAGIWLLFWPCLIGAFLAHPAGWWDRWPLFLLGAIAMRSAGCVWNDIVDRDLDRQVARTASRPVASGAIPVRHALVFLVALSLVGLAVLLALPRQAQWVALAALVPVALYPYMKRITWWPQAWLGLTFNWGVPVGWAAADPWYRADWPVMALAWAAALCWTLGYDSIYAAQDVEDDALAGVKSSARRLGPCLKPAIGLFYAATILLLGAALHRWQPTPLILAGLLPAAIHLAVQWRRFQPESPVSALAVFRLNATTGGLLALAAAFAALLDGLGHAF